MKKNMKVGGSKATVLTIVKYIATILLFVFYMVPFILVVINSVKANRDIIRNPFSLFETSAPPTFSNYTGAFERMDFLRAFGNSFFITGLSTVLVIVLSAMVAYYIVRNKTKASNIVYFGMIASMIIPFQAIMIPLVSIYGATLGLLNHRLTLVFLHVGFGMSMSVFMFAGFLRSSIPLSLEEAATIDGCSKYQTFFRIVFPLLKPTTATLVVLNVMAYWNDYLLPSLVLGERDLYTLPLSTYSFYGTYASDYGMIMAALILTVLPLLILYLILQRQIINGVVAGAVKS